VDISCGSHIQDHLHGLAQRCLTKKILYQYPYILPNECSREGGGFAIVQFQVEYLRDLIF